MWERQSIIRYFELLGLPGSGKTTLLKSIRKLGLPGKQVRTYLSEDLATTFLRIGIRSVKIGQGGGKPFGPSSFPLFLKEALFDHWHQGTLTKFPELFSAIFASLAEVPDSARQREIIANYWRVRVLRYSEISESDAFEVGLVDEGLAQTVLSTISRTSCLPERRSELVRRMIRWMPPRRAIIHLRTSPDLALERRGDTARSFESLVSLESDIDSIVREHKRYGFSVYVVDGGASLQDARREIGQILEEESNHRGP